MRTRCGPELLDIYEVRGEQREAMLTLAREARQRGWWQSYSSDAVPEWFQVYLGLEAEASSIHEYAAELVPGLLPPAPDRRLLPRFHAHRPSRGQRRSH
ncbi:MAG TPA: hypothetical protein VIV12_07410 [Streptosporangiaceae bacterium]